ncbi:hypothetical protein AAEX28_05705 [Lentisphaerota bacterium WC36G]|nr:hypothetical protein LJT99_08565 [Lentisphaerae bacterium WC36]
MFDEKKIAQLHNFLNFIIFLGATYVAVSFIIKLLDNSGEMYEKISCMPCLDFKPISFGIILMTIGFYVKAKLSTKNIDK